MWIFPLPEMEVVGVTWDSMSFQNIDYFKQLEIPIGNHVGSFGAIRKHDIHKGVDLYCPQGTTVHAVEDGRVVDIRWFTGEKVGFPWWRNTMGISIEGETGVVVYGELITYKKIKVGDQIHKEDAIGEVEQVMIKDNNRPLSMLHFALHRHAVLSNGRWEIGKSQPSGLLDPTNRLISSVWKDDIAEKARRYPKLVQMQGLLRGGETIYVKYYNYEFLFAESEYGALKLVPTENDKYKRYWRTKYGRWELDREEGEIDRMNSEVHIDIFADEQESIKFYNAFQKGLEVNK